MARRVLGILALAAAAAALAAPASAEGNRATKAAPADYRGAPVKDCTRYNGRWGYYGNPWCTAAEQARWDRWSAGRR